MLGPSLHERWSVKTGADPDAQALTNQAPTTGTIAELTALPVPPLLPPNGRSDGAEKTLWSVQAILTAYAAEADGDYHMVIADQAGRTMIAEVPKPGDIPGRRTPTRGGAPTRRPDRGPTRRPAPCSLAIRRNAVPEPSRAR